MLLANQLYYAVEAQEYDKKNHVSNPAIRRYYDRLLDRFIFEGRPAAETHKWKACDVGCGTGFLETLVADRVGSLVAFDATHRMLSQARSKFAGRPVTWVQADAQALPISQPVFDLVCSNAMLHHVYGFDRVLASMIAMLKPGGKLFLGYEPNAIPYQGFLAATEGRGEDRPGAPQSGCDQSRERSGCASSSEGRGHPRAFRVSHFPRNGGPRHPPFSSAETSSSGTGSSDCRVHFSSVYQFALLRDSGVPVPVQLLPDWFFRLSGRLSLSFSLTGRKAV